MKPELVVDDSSTTYFTVEFSRLGLNAFSVSILSGIWTGEVSNFFKKHGWIINSKGLSSNVKSWFEYLLSGSFILISGFIVADVLDINLHQILSVILMPIMGLSNTLVGWVLINATAPLLFYIGIHPYSFFAISTPIYMETLAENMKLLAQGLEPTVSNGFYIANFATSVFLDLGGAGSTLALNILMLFSRNKSVKRLGQLAIFPSILNINEPIIFGIPIIFNPIMLVPFVLGVCVNAFLTYIVIGLGWVAVPASYALSFHIPSVINAYILTKDFRAVIFIIGLIALDMVIWAPFLRIHEKQLEKKEMDKKNCLVGHENGISV